MFGGYIKVKNIVPRLPHYKRHSLYELLVNNTWIDRKTFRFWMHKRHVVQ